MYKDKYLKYKSKYLQLKNMKAGGKPNVFSLKNINLFTKGSDIEIHLNPAYGFIYNEYNVIENYINFYNPKNKISKLVKNTFNKIHGAFQPTNKLLFNLKPSDLGKFLGCKIIYKFYITEINDHLEKLNSIVKIINNKRGK